MKRRPALVLSPASFNATFGLAFVAPVTTKPKGHAFEVRLPAGCGAKGVVIEAPWTARNRPPVK
jgi:mRNA interferase MazF